jgi:hypothetical protein
VAEDYDGPFGGREIASDIAGLVLAWGTGWEPDMPGARRVWGSADRETVLRSGRARTMAGILTARIWEASALAASGRPVRLLAEPESERGVIGPDRLLARLESWAGGDLSRHDLEVALLRLTPGLDEEFWSAWTKVHPASVGAARYAYEQSQVRLGFEPELGWLVRETAPLVLARITGRPAEADASRCWALLTALSQPLRDFVSVYGRRWEMTPRYEAVVAGWPLLCPWQPELAAAHLLRPLSDGLRPGSSRVGAAATAVRGLLVSGSGGVPGSGGSGSGGAPGPGGVSGSGGAGSVGPIGHLALVTGLAAAEPYVRIAAAEVFERACRQGWLDPGLAAGALVTGVRGGVFKLNRVADGLEHAWHEPAAGLEIVRTVFAAADALIPDRPANLHLLLELAARIGAVTGSPAPPAEIVRLAAAKGGSRLAASARAFESTMITKSLLLYMIEKFS